MTGQSAPTRQPQSWLERKFLPLLLATAAAGLIPLVVLGTTQFLGFDGWWHVFIATQDRWLMVAGEWKGIAHPPLFYPLLRLAAAISHSLLALRAVSILSGAASTVVIGVVAAKIYRYKAAALLVAAAHAFSWSMIELNSDVRAYPLALLFVLLAFDALVDWTADPEGPMAARAILRFGGYSLLAILSEYYVIFFLAACVGVLLLRAILRPAFRVALLRSIRSEWKIWLLSFASVSGVFLTCFLFHMIVRPQDQAYLQPYVFHNDPAMEPDWFVQSNLTKELGYFTPFGLDPALLLWVVALIFVPALVYLVFFRKNDRGRALSIYPPLLLAGILVQLIVLGLAGRYPFGGEWRHQSIIAPFVLLTALLLLDRLAGILKAPLARNAIFVVAGLTIAGSFAFGWSVCPWSSTPLMSAEYRLFRAQFPEANNIYGDNTSAIFFYSHTHNANWAFQDRFLARDQRITVYQVDEGSGQTVRLLRNKHETFLDLTNPETYQTIAAALRNEGRRTVVLFDVGRGWDDAGARTLENSVRTLAPNAGLESSRVSVGRTFIFAEFTLLN